MLARLGKHRTGDPVGGGDGTQRVGGGVLTFWVGGGVGARSAEGGIGFLSNVARPGRCGDVEPSRHPGVVAMPSDDGGRVECSPSGAVAAEQPGDALILCADIGAAVASDVHKRAEHVWMHDGQANGAGTAHRPSGDAPISSVSAYAEVRHHEWHNILCQVIGGIAAAAVDALGVVVEGAGGINE